MEKLGIIRCQGRVANLWGVSGRHQASSSKDRQVLLAA
ncbi:hypothetical protein C4K39_0443 [Pseudomonas sessilinigenes]|nr:hypothetical protein C4K39_0443 [Pseudomonas sessilinigenes]